MRSLLFSMLIAAVCVSLFTGAASAVGVYVAGKEECKCSPLVARGMVPDALNKLTEVPVWAALSAVVERVAVELRSMLGQFGTEASLRESEPEIKPLAKVEPEPVRTKEKEKAALTKKTKKHKKVKLPPTVK